MRFSTAIVSCLCCTVASFIHTFLSSAVLRLTAECRASLVCHKRFCIAMASCVGAWALEHGGSVVASQHTDLNFPIKAQSCVPCPGRRFLLTDRPLGSPHPSLPRCCRLMVWIFPPSPVLADLGQGLDVFVTSFSAFGAGSSPCGTRMACHPTRTDSILSSQKPLSGPLFCGTAPLCPAAPGPKTPQQPFEKNFFLIENNCFTML